MRMVFFAPVLLSKFNKLRLVGFRRYRGRDAQASSPMRKGHKKCKFNNKRTFTYGYHATTFPYIMWNVYPPPFGTLIPCLATLAKERCFAARRRPAAIHQTCEVL